MFRVQRLHGHLAAHPAAATPAAPGPPQQPNKKSDGGAGGRSKVVSLLSRCSGPEDLTASAARKTLEDDDIASFKANGFLIKTGLLDPQKLDAARSGANHCDATVRDLDL